MVCMYVCVCEIKMYMVCITYACIYIYIISIYVCVSSITSCFGVSFTVSFMVSFKVLFRVSIG